MVRKNGIIKVDYLKFLDEIKQKIVSSRINAYRGLNRELIKLYWEIGKTIVGRQERFGWGKSVVEKLSVDLQKEIPATRGYSAQNLWYMRQFYLEYRDFPNLQQLVGEIPWGQNLVILSRIKGMGEREFYIRGTIQFGWSRNVLVHQIEAEAHKQAKVEKMNFYLNLLDDAVRQSDENPSIGIILCKDRDRLEVEYALRGIRKPIGVSEYRLTNKLPRKLMKSLPSPEELKRGLKG